MTKFKAGEKVLNIDGTIGIVRGIINSQVIVDYEGFPYTIYTLDGRSVYFLDYPPKIRPLTKLEKNLHEI